MSVDFDDEITQDFLVESSEILEALGEQLVQLEQSPDDMDLLNTVFRGFHTIKGGAGFLALNALVDVVHRAEDVFNMLRQGDRAVDSNLMDVFFRVLDVLNEQFDEMRAQQEPTAAPDNLLKALEELLAGKEATAHMADGGAPAEEAPAAEPPASDDADIDNVLDALEGDAKSDAGNEEPKLGVHMDPPKPAGGGDHITDEEFEALLDEIHGANAPGKGAEKVVEDESPSLAAYSGSGDKISDDEFDALLDELYGAGKGPTNPDGTARTDADTQSAQPNAEPEKPAPPPEAEKPAISKEALEQAVAQAPPTKPEVKPAAAKPPAKNEGAKAAPPKGDNTVRVDTARLDDIMNLVGELVLVRNRLTTLRGEIDHEGVSKAVADLELVTSDLQSAVMKTRMQPIKKVFGRFPRVVRDLARNLKKEVKLELLGEETDLDKNLVEGLADPLIHLVRNAVDHGLETSEDRIAKGKPVEGTIILGAEQEGDHILLTIQDDGKGMDPDVLRQKAIEKKLLDPESAARLDARDCFNLIFLPGFSTKSEISDISGRGVGMDVVKTRITQLNGSIDIDSDLGVGTTINIKVPLTLAILPTLMVTLRHRKFALPMGIVREIFELKSRPTNVVDGQLCVMVREKAMPIFFLDRWLFSSRLAGSEAAIEASSQNRRDGQVIAVNVANLTVGFVVDQVLGLEEVVIKPLGAVLQGMPGLAGSTITGDGRIALIIDVPSLVKEYGNGM